MGRFLSIVSVLLASLVSACGGRDIVCPGHIDPMAPPTMQIESLDGSNSIATAEVMEGPCNMGWKSFFDAATGVRGVTVSRKDGMFGGTTSEPCIVRVSSVDGYSVTVTAMVECYVSSTTQTHCVDNSNCCPKSELSTGASQRCEFTQKAIEVSFATASYDAGAVDGVALDRAID